MAKNTSILLGDYFNNFVHEQVKSGKYASKSEVVRAALRLLEYEETKKNELIKELNKGITAMSEKVIFVLKLNHTSFSTKSTKKKMQ